MQRSVDPLTSRPIAPSRLNVNFIDGDELKPQHHTIVTSAGKKSKKEFGIYSPKPPRGPSESIDLQSFGAARGENTTNTFFYVKADARPQQD